MCPCCGETTNRFNANCEGCFMALLEGRDHACEASHGTPTRIGKDDYQGSHTTTAGKRFRITEWAAGELAELASEGVIFESFGNVMGVERFARTRYVSDNAGNLHCYDSEGARKMIHPAGRKLRILTV